MAPYLAFIRSSLLGMLAYRMRYFTGILTYLLYVSIHYFIWQAVFQGASQELDPTRTINGYTFPEMVTYITMAWIARSLYFSNVDYEIDEIVKSGQLSIFLLRPVSFQLLMISQACGELLFRMIFFSLPIGVVIAAIFPILPPNGLSGVALFLLATAVSFLIMAELNFLVGLVAIHFQSISSLMQAKHYLLQLLSGLLIPLTFFPPAAEAILKVLPFQLLTYVPLQFYLGKVGPGETMWLLLHMGFWVMCLHLLGVVFWRYSASRVVVQGG